MSSRVDRYGGSGSFGDPRSDSRRSQEERQRRFARQHRPGDVVYGVPVQPGPRRLTWVDINGHLLLADIGDATAALLCFTVEATEPEIVLKIHTNQNAPSGGSSSANAGGATFTGGHVPVESPAGGILPNGLLSDGSLPGGFASGGVPPNGFQLGESPPDGFPSGGYLPEGYLPEEFLPGADSAAGGLSEVELEALALGRLSASASGANAHGAPVLPPSRLATLYSAARSAMDRHLAEVLWPRLGPPQARAQLSREKRKAAFATHLAESPVAAERANALFGAMGLLAPALNRFADMYKASAALMLHLPWLDPEARALDCLLLIDEQAGQESILPPPPENRNDPFAAYPLDPDVLARILLGGQGIEARLVYGCLRRDMGRMLCEVSIRPGEITARLLAQNPEALAQHIRLVGEYPLAPPGVSISSVERLPEDATAPLQALLAVVMASRLSRIV